MDSSNNQRKRMHDEAHHNYNRKRMRVETTQNVNSVIDMITIDEECPPESDQPHQNDSSVFSLTTIDETQPNVNRVVDVITIDDDDVITLSDSESDDDVEFLCEVNQRGGETTLEDLCQIQVSQRSIKRHVRFVSVIVRTLTFPRMERISEPLHMAVPRLFDQFLDQCLEASGVRNPLNALFCLTLSHPSFENGHIFLSFRKRAELDGVAIMNFLNKIQQSKKEILLSQDLSAELYIFDEQVPVEPVALNGGARIVRYFDPDLKIKGITKNTDGYCLPRSIALGMLKADEEAEQDPEIKERMRVLRKNYTARGKPELHIKLLTEAGIELGRSTYGLTELQAIAAKNMDYMIVLYTRPAGQKLYSIFMKLNPNGSKIVNIGYHNEHYDTINPVLGNNSFSAVICRSCKQSYHSKPHQCKLNCSKCHRKNCNSETVEEAEVYRICSSCNVQFMSQGCFETHVGEICRQYKACTQCFKYYRVKGTRPHVCDTRFCNTCKRIMPAEHECCWMPPGDKQRQQAKKDQESYKLVFYDFETVVLEDGINLAKYNTEQWPNLVAYKRFCSNCVNSTGPCSTCVAKRGYFRYQPADSEWSVTDRFLDWILYNPANNMSLFIAHNGSRFDIHFLISRLVNKGIYPRMILNGTQIIQMAIEPMKGQKFNAVTFKDSYLLVPLPLAALPKAFDVPELAKGEFPYLFNHPINYGKTLATLPERKYYCTDRKKSEALASFEAWYENRKNYPFDFDLELLAYCEMDVLILAESMKKYMLLATATTGWNPLIHCTTFGSFSMMQLKMNHLQPNQVGILPENGYNAGQTIAFLLH